MAVDMVQAYLDQLPDLPNVEKVCAAISDREERLACEYVPCSTIERWEKIFARQGSWTGWRAMGMARGCSALRFHRVLQNILKQIGLLHLVRRKPVQTISIGNLLAKHR